MFSERNRCRSVLVSCVLIVLLMGGILAVLPSKAESQEAQLPSRELGDKWIYKTTMSENELTIPFINELMSNTTYEITNSSIIISGYDCIEITNTIGGNISSAGFIGTYSGISKIYETKKDHSLVKSEWSLECITTGFNRTIKLVGTTESSWNPPFNSCDFPLSVGKSWSSTTNQTTKTSMTSDEVSVPFGKFETTNKTTVNFVVLRIENTKVPAGEFQTFVISETNDDGTSSESYYSPKVHQYVKQLSYDAKGNLLASLELLSYQVTEPQEGFPSIYLVISGIIILVLILIISILFAVRARRKGSLNPPLAPNPSD